MNKLLEDIILKEKVLFKNQSGLLTFYSFQQISCFKSGLRKMYSGLAIIFDLQVKYNEGFLLALQLSIILFFEDRFIEYK